MATAWENANLFERFEITQGQLKSERQNCEEDFEQIINVFNPGLTDFEERDPSKKIKDRFNGTPASALRIMADGLQGSTVSRAIPWLRYILPRLAGEDSVIKWLQAVEEHMYPVYAKSGFYPALGPYFRQALSVGTPALISEENRITGKIECTVPHPRENYFAFDSWGEPVRYHRVFDKRVDELVVDLKQMNIETSLLSQATQTLITGGIHNKRVKMMQVFYRADDPIFEGLTFSGRGGDIKPARPWITYILEVGADVGERSGKKVPIEARGYWARPHAVWRYEISTDETYARTPAWFSLHDAKGEITASKSLQMAGEGYVRPNYLATQDMRGKIRRKPGSTTYMVTDKSEVRDMPSAGKNYPISSEERDRMVRNVERWFDVEFFLMINRLAASGGSPPTATQIIEMSGEKALLMGTRLERLVNDALTPIDDRFFDIELNAGRMPEPPDIVLDPDNEIERVDAEFIGPLLQVQKKSFAVRRYLEGKGVIDGFIETWPQAIHKINFEDFMERTLEALGFDQASIVSKDEFAIIMEDIAQREREKQQLETGAAIADAVPKLSKSVEANSPLAAVGA